MAGIYFYSANTLPLKNRLRAGIIFSGLLCLLNGSAVGSQAESSRQYLNSRPPLRLFVSPDESSSYTELPTGDHPVLPIAEVFSGNGSKWFLVKTRDGLRGWIKSGDSDEAKISETFFKSLPREPIPLAVVPSTSPARNPMLVPMRMAGAAAIVSVILNRTVPASMLVDTGASHTVVSRQLAARLRLAESGQSSMVTASGAITVSMTVLSSIMVGGAEAVNLTVAVHDISNNGNFDGLLGMDFLSRFNASIDSRRRLLVLSPR